MRRIWITLTALCCLNAVLLSGCPIGPPFDADRIDTHGGSNGGNGSNGGM